MRKKKQVYPPPKTATKGGSAAPDSRPVAPSRVVSIDTTAKLGKAGIVPGMRVEIASGLYAGEAAVVESVVGGVIPAVSVRTDAGRTRRVRSVDIVPLRERSEDGAPASE